MTIDSEDAGRGRGFLGGWHFSKRIDLGQLLAASLFAAGLGGWAFSGYLTIEKRFTAAEKDYAVTQKRFEIVDLELAAEKERTKEGFRDAQERSVQNEKQIDNIIREVRDLANVERAYQEKLSQAIADVRTLIASGQRR